jgi:hypothetical protein
MNVRGQDKENNKKCNILGALLNLFHFFLNSMSFPTCFLENKKKIFKKKNEKER